ncbi:MAG: fasciclin domain-containing protein, partial [Bacteroidales bacterium]|nr:fasciclin domain-containing protein [Bacteroidales bacterium]
MVFNFCAEEPQLWKVESQEQVIGDYIASNPDQFSEFEKLIEVTGKRALLNVRGPYTVFLPTNEAMLAYYTLKNVNSLDDFSESFQNE